MPNKIYESPDGGKTVFERNIGDSYDKRKKLTEAKMRDHEYTVDIDSFNNKGYKGDDDFETWMRTEAPFVPDAKTGTLGEGSSSYTVNADSITISSNYTVDDNWQKRMSIKLPVDIMHTLYPKEMKGETQ